jgi:hypothetical protein
MTGSAFPARTPRTARVGKPVVEIPVDRYQHVRTLLRRTRVLQCQHKAGPRDDVEVGQLQRVVDLLSLVPHVDRPAQVQRELLHKPLVRRRDLVPHNERPSDGTHEQEVGLYAVKLRDSVRNGDHVRDISPLRAQEHETQGDGRRRRGKIDVESCGDIVSVFGSIRRPVDEGAQAVDQISVCGYLGALA